MKKVSVLLVMVLGLSTSISFAQAAPKENKAETVNVKKNQTPEFVEIYMNDLPEAVMDTLACQGAMIKQAFLSYDTDGSRIYKVIILSSNFQEMTEYLNENGKIIK